MAQTIRPSRSAQVITFFLTLTAMSPARADQDLLDTVTTREASLQAGGSTYQQIEVDGHDYYLKSPRPGSSLVEVWCQAPRDLVSNPSVKNGARAKSYTQKLAEGCATKNGLPPEHFTFEEKASKTSQANGSWATPASKSKSMNARSYPEDVHPSILPDPIAPATEFPVR